MKILFSFLAILFLTSIPNRVDAATVKLFFLNITQNLFPCEFNRKYSKLIFLFQDSENLKYHYKFNNNLNDEISGTPLTTTNCPGSNYEFRPDEKGTANQAIYFKSDNTGCLLENDGSNIVGSVSDITISFWIKKDIDAQGISITVVKAKEYPLHDDIVLIFDNSSFMY